MKYLIAVLVPYPAETRSGAYTGIRASGVISGKKIQIKFDTAIEHIGHGNDKPSVACPPKKKIKRHK